MTRLFYSVTVVIAMLCCCAAATAAITPIFEYSFPASYDGSTATTITDLSTAGNNAAMDFLRPLILREPLAVLEPPR